MTLVSSPHTELDLIAIGPRKLDGDGDKDGDGDRDTPEFLLRFDIVHGYSTFHTT